MGTYYYWINDKLKIGVFLGRGLNTAFWDESDAEEIMNKKKDGLFSENLSDALSEKTLKDVTLKDLSLILEGARYFSNFALLEHGTLEVYVLNKIFGKGKVVSHYELEDYKDYKILGEE